jgi:hypothetical protein
MLFFAYFLYDSKLIAEQIASGSEYDDIAEITGINQ